MFPRMYLYQTDGSNCLGGDSKLKCDVNDGSADSISHEAICHGIGKHEDEECNQDVLNRTHGSVQALLPFLLLYDHSYNYSANES